MVLQEILFGTFVPPAVKSRVFKVGFASCERYVPPKVREYKRQEANKPDTLVGSNKRVYDIVKRCKVPVTANDIEKKAHYTRNHCSIVLASLFKLGLLTRKKVHSNGTRYFLYQVKESDASNQE